MLHYHINSVQVNIQTKSKNTCLQINIKMHNAQCSLTTRYAYEDFYKIPSTRQGNKKIKC